MTYENGRERTDVWSKRTWTVDPKTVHGFQPTVLTQEQAQALQENALSRLTLWEQSGIIAAEASPRRSKNGEFDVNWSVIQSTDYSEKFRKLSSDSRVSDAIEARAKWALNNRTGEITEELYAVSLVDGREIARITDQHYDSGVKRTPLFTRRLNDADAHGEPILLLHNHPRGLPPSISDINALMCNTNVSGITVGHNGSVYRYTRPEHEISEFDWRVELRRFKDYSEITSMEKALEALSQRYGFEFEML